MAFSFYLDNVDGSEAVSQAKVGVTPRSFSTGKEGRGEALIRSLLHLIYFAIATLML